MTGQDYGGPLRGYRVLELGTMVAGPFCGRMLADFGADVVKIEVPSGDPVRGMGKRVDGKSLYASSIFRNKWMVSVDLRTEKGRDVIRAMLPKIDVLIENFRPGTLERWDLGYDQLSALNPGLVMVRISGFGQDGPYSRRAGYGVIGEAMSGMRHLTGDPDRPPARVSVSLTDYIAGLHAAYGVTLALLARDRTGKGQYIDTALYEAAFNFMEPYVPAYEKTGFIATRTGSRLPNNTPNNLYASKDGEFIHLAAVSESTWQRLMRAIGREDALSDPRFATLVSRYEHQDTIDEMISAWTEAHTLDEVDRVLQEADVAASRIYTMADIFSDPHYAARDMLVDVADAELGTVKLANVVPKLSSTPGRIRRAGGQVGVDTRSVLSGLAGLAEDEIEALVRDGVVYCGDGHSKQRES
ncbi:MAG: CoA transferase [Alphaproteobacteria bacterium]|nr:CoA transferase [Alphaproteobacteria bacterium]